MAPEQPRIVRVFSNNAVLVRDDEGVERVLVGRGIGFGRRTGERIAGDRAQRTYVPIQPEKAPLMAVIDDLDATMVRQVGAAVDLASDLLGELHPSVYLILTEHLSFAIGRVRQGKHMYSTILAEVAGAFPEEFRAAQIIVHYLNSTLPSSDLPEEEAAAVALHLNAARSGVTVKTPLAQANQLAAWTDTVLERLGGGASAGEADEELVAALARVYRRLREGRARETELAPLIAHHLPEEYHLAVELLADMGAKAPGEAALLAVLLHGWRLERKENRHG